MAEIRSFFFAKHVRGEPTAYLRYFKDGLPRAGGPGLSFWFFPLGASLAEVPLDDRELPFVFHARTKDFQDVAVAGVIQWRAAEPDVLSTRVDFSIDPGTGAWQKEPLDQVALVLNELAAERAADHVARRTLRELLEASMEEVREVVHAGLTGDEALARMGIVVVATRVSAVKPAPEVERALQVPAREMIQQRADEATFQRRATAVEKERAIQENELATKIELAKRQELLIDQDGKNERRRAQEKAQAAEIESQAAAKRVKTQADAQAESIIVLEDARVKAERARMDIYKELPPTELLGLAALAYAQKKAS